ncbi:MAG: AAA family ATPase [bacterium]
MISFDDFIGQEKIKKDLKIHMERSFFAFEPLDHIMFYGGAGLGKTTLATAVAEEMGSTIVTKTGDEINKETLWEILTTLPSNAIFFIDEIHSLPVKVCEILYGPLQIINNQKLAEETTDFLFEGEYISPFTLIGGTTSPGMLTKPMRDRIILDYYFEPYSVEELTTILINYNCPQNAAVIIAERSRGVPRIALKHFIRIRNRAMETENITPEICLETFDDYGIHNDGFSDTDIKILKYLAARGSASESEIYRTLDVDASDYRGMYEPFLLQKGLIRISSKGRELTKAGLSIVKEC